MSRFNVMPRNPFVGGAIAGLIYTTAIVVAWWLA